MYPTLGLITLGLLFTPPALANETHVGSNHNQISGLRGEIHGNLDRYSVFGLGGRLEFAIVPNGIVSGNVRDELALSLGADIFFAPVNVYDGYYYSGGAYLVPIAAVQWNFYLGDRWSLFPELGLALHSGFDGRDWKDPDGRSVGWLYLEPDIGVGARFHFSPSVALLLRISTPGGAQLGLVF